MRMRVGSSGPLFMSLEMRERVGVRVDLFFMSSEKRKRIKTRLGLFFTSLKMRASLGPVDLFFMSLKTRKRIKIPTDLFSRDSFFLTLACYNGNRKSKGG